MEGCQEKKKGGEKAGGEEGRGRMGKEGQRRAGLHVGGKRGREGGPSQPPPGVGCGNRGAPCPPHPRPSPGCEKATDQQSHSAELQKPSARVAKKH